MKYYMFIDESGDHGLVNLDKNFPVFLLCGMLVEEVAYFKMRDELNKLKNSIWKNKEVVLHSRDIRKCEKEFQVLFDMEIKQHFYLHLNNIISEGNYTIFAAAIQKERYINKYGRLSNDVYEIALSFIIERAVFYLDNIKEQKTLQIVIEKRGKKEDKQLDEHFQRLKSRGTSYVDSERLAVLQIEIHFRDKKENINGLQFADLLAYPIARYAIDKNRANPAFDLLAKKFYTKGGKRYGLKIFP